MAFDQQTRELAFKCDGLGDNDLLAHRLRYTEELGRPFRCEIDLLSEEDTVAFADVLGKKGTISIMLRGTSLAEASASDIRYMSGVISSFDQLGANGDLFEYRLTLVPFLWQLTLAQTCRIFQGKTVPDIVKDVLREAGFTDVKENFAQEYSPRLFCAQYCETTFNFISRLLEEEGIYYYFEHEDGKHTLVLCDSGVHEPFAGFESVAFDKPRLEHISRFGLRQRMTSTFFKHSDYDFKMSDTMSLLEANSPALFTQDHSEFEVFSFPGNFTDETLEDGAGEAHGSFLADVRMGELQHGVVVATGQTLTCRGLMAGYAFSLSDHPRDSWNGDYLITRTEVSMVSDDYQSTGDAKEPLAYRCTFQACPTGTGVDMGSWRYTPRRITPKPRISGLQTGIVVGDDELNTDEWGRVRVAMPWDNTGEEKITCWVRVAQAWAGASFGAFFTPRKDQEVVMAFLEGDPDRPLIVGSVHNLTNPPPVAMPDDATQSTITTATSPGGFAEGFNEIRFEDKAGEELLSIHAQLDKTVDVLNDRTTTIGNDETFTVTNDRTGTVDNNETLTVKVDRARTVNGNEDITVDGDHTLTIGGTETVDITGDVSETYSGNHDETCSKEISLTADSKITLTVGGSTVEISASEIKLATGGSTLTLGASEASLQSPTVSIKGDMEAKIEGGMTAEVKGGISAALKGAMADLKADGIATVKGSMNMIG